jgi:hypothetical protein
MKQTILVILERNIEIVDDSHCSNNCPQMNNYTYVCALNNETLYLDYPQALRKRTSYCMFCKEIS